MRSSEIVTRALNLADLQNSKFITWNDKSESLFESYRDIYADLLDAEDDFFLTDLTITVSAGQTVGTILLTEVVTETGVTIVTNYPTDISPVSMGMLQEWLIPMPSDCMRIRYVLYNGPSVWMPMDKFQILDMNVVGSPPRYRWQNGNLWIIGQTYFNWNQIRVGYYPKQPIATVPDEDYSFGAGITQLSDVSLVTSPAYCDQNTSLAYIYDGTKLEVDSLDLGTNSTLLYTGASTISNLVYYSGYFYWLLSGDVYRAPYLSTGTITPVQLTSLGTVTSFSVSTYDQKIYYTNGTYIYAIALSGGSAAQITSAPGSSTYNFGGQFTFYVDASGNLVTTIGTQLASSVVSASTDYSTFIFYLDMSRNLYSGEVTITAGIPSLTSTLLRSGVQQCGPFFESGPVYFGTMPSVTSGRIPVVTDSFNMLAISSIVDYDFSYPLNEANEIMAYQSAIDYRRKQDKDFSGLQLRLGERAQDGATGRPSGLWSRFEAQIVQRDQFRPERVANKYVRGWW